MKLFVTTHVDCNGWVAYTVLNGLAICVARARFNGLDDLRYYAKREGYSDLVVKQPSMPWGRISGRVNQPGYAEDVG